MKDILINGIENNSFKIKPQFQIAKPKGDSNPAKRIHEKINSRNQGIQLYLYLYIGLYQINTIKYCLKSIDLQYKRKHIDLVNWLTTDITPNNDSEDIDFTHKSKPKQILL